MSTCKQCGEEITDWMSEDYDGYCYDCWTYFNQDGENNEHS